MKENEIKMNGGTYYLIDEEDYILYEKFMKNKAENLNVLGITQDKLKHMHNYVAYVVTNLKKIIESSSDDELYDLMITLSVAISIMGLLGNGLSKSAYSREDVDKVIERLGAAICRM